MFKSLSMRRPRRAIGVALLGSALLVGSTGVGAATLRGSDGSDDGSVDAEAIKDAIEVVVAAGKVLWSFFSEHPVERWTGNELMMPVRYMPDQESRVSNNLDKAPFSPHARVCRYRWVKGTVSADDVRTARVTFMADKQGRKDRPRSRSVRAGELFVMSTPTSADRNYYVARLEARGGREAFAARNPSATLVLELIPDNRLHGVLLAEHKDFSGSGRFLSAGERVADFNAIGFNDKASSIKCFGGARFDAYEHANYRGEHTVMSGTSSDIHGIGWGDKISSAVVK